MDGKNREEYWEEQGEIVAGVCVSKQKWAVLDVVMSLISNLLDFLYTGPVCPMYISTTKVLYGSAKYIYKSE